MKASVLVVLALVLVASASAAGQTTTPPSETEALRKRLQDAGCLDAAAKDVSKAELDAAIHACPDQTPRLRIETGMHTAPINSIGVDAACRLLATGSDDKTVRIWSLPDGKFQKVVRLPIGEGNRGNIFATTVSGDGQLLAIGRNDGFALGDGTTAALYLYDISKPAEPKLVRRLPFGSRITQLSFSADGARLALGFKGPQGIGVRLGAQGVRVIDLRSQREVLADNDYAGDVYGLAFAPDGALIASSADGELRRYGQDLKLTVKRAAPEDKSVHGVAIDSSGQHVAVGYLDKSAVSILNATTLAPLAKGENSDLAGWDLSRVAWSRNGAVLIAGGRAGKHGSIVRRFDPSGRRNGEDVTAAESTIFDIKTCDQGFVFAAADPRFGLISAHGVVKTLQGPRTADMRGKLGSAFTLSPDASSVRFELAVREGNAVLFDLSAAALTDSPGLPPNFLTAKVDGLPVTDWENNEAPNFDGAKLALESSYETSRALAIRPDASGFILGTEWYVRAYDAGGRERWKQGGPTAYGVAFSADGEILVVAYSDGTIRWRRGTDGKELLALFVEPQSRKWVAWTPSGYYMASAGGEDLIGWHINRGWAQEAEFYPASQFHDRYYRPDIVRAVLKTRDEGRAVELADAERARQGVAPKPGEPAPGVLARPEELATILPPQATIVSPVNGAIFFSDSVDIDYRLHAPQGGSIDSLTVEVDGRKFLTLKGLRESAEGTVTLEAPKRDFVVSLTPAAGDLVGAPAKIKLVYAGASPPTPAKPDLYVLALGVDTYENDKEFPRTYAQDDVDGLTTALKRQEGVFFGHVEIKPLMDNQVTVDNLRAYFDEIAGKVTDNDYVFLYLAGHGLVTADNVFHFMTRKGAMNLLNSTSLSERDLTEPLASVRGKKIILLESCHAGAAVEKDNEKSRFDMGEVANRFQVQATVTFFGAAQGYQFAHFDPKWGNRGAFTQALIEGLDGKAAKSGYVTVYTLREYLIDRVGALTDHSQSPFVSQTNEGDFQLAQTRP